ncbi:glucosamine inositolphosphorylceramide transferase family protein [Aquihabitans sp. McL0605]|uniref:glucosamine inositolphosphorylceramide transferase family protein n=1 Tax=Aquihabitans sp. McL0605 TaxID=3415671 RepID=UPI003CF31771
MGEGTWEAGGPWRPLARVRRNHPRWRAFVDGRLEQLRRRSPGLVDDSWWIATGPPSEPEGLDPAGLSRLRNPRNDFLADPVALVGADDEYLVEQYRFATRRGVISHLRFTPDGGAELREGVIDAPFHLSFPTTFRHDGRTWIVPEAHESGATHLWEYRPDEGASRHVGPIIDVPVRDAVIFEHGGRWYLLGTGALPAWHLVLYVTDDPLTTWEQIPIENRTSYVRPGGSLVPRPAGDGTGPDAWIAPMQGSSRGYGSELALCELRLAPEPLLVDGPVVEPPPPFIGLHTLAMGRSQTVVDLKHLRLRPDRLVYRVRPERLLRKLRRRPPAPAAPGS